MSDKQDPELTRIDLDPYGDVIFVLKDVELKMSSKALSLASPVFKALLRPTFSEGQALRDGKTARIEFPDDDTEAMKAICKCAHFQPDDTANVTDKWLVNLATVTDKYDCLGATRCFGALALASISSKTEQELSNGQLLLPAYVLDDYVSFKTITKRMVFELNGVGQAHATACSVYGLSEDMEQVLPAGLAQTLINHEWAVKKNLLAGIESMITALTTEDAHLFMITKECLHQNITSRDIELFDDVGLQTGPFLAELCKIQLLPTSAAYEKFTLSSMIAALEKPNNNLGNFSSNDVKTSVGLHILVDDAKHAFSGLCLDCVNRGWQGLNNVKKPCRVPHRGCRGILKR